MCRHQSLKLEYCTARCFVIIDNPRATHDFQNLIKARCGGTVLLKYHTSYRTVCPLSDNFEQLPARRSAAPRVGFELASIHVEAVR